jgi:hypothetical protein
VKLLRKVGGGRRADAGGTISLHRCRTHRPPCHLVTCLNASRSHCDGEWRGVCEVKHLAIAWIHSSFSLSDSAHIKTLSSLELISKENCFLVFESAAWESSDLSERVWGPSLRSNQLDQSFHEVRCPIAVGGNELKSLRETQTLEKKILDPFKIKNLFLHSIDGERKRFKIHSPRTHLLCLYK